MGPYCNFCNQRCFTHLPLGTPMHIVTAYKGATIIATCPGGQQYEQDRVGYSYDEIRKLPEVRRLERSR